MKKYLLLTAGLLMATTSFADDMPYLSNSGKATGEVVGGDRDLVTSVGKLTVTSVKHVEDFAIISLKGDNLSGEVIVKMQHKADSDIKINEGTVLEITEAGDKGMALSVDGKIIAYIAQKPPKVIATMDR